MKNEICLLCLQSTHLSDEHIIPASIGGFLVKPIYCATCNNTLGRTIDAELSNFFRKYSTILNIKRKRGKIQPFEVTDTNSGLKVRFNGDGFVRKKPIVNLFKNENGDLEGAEIIERSKKELERKVNEISKKYNTNWVFDSDSIEPDGSTQENVSAIEDVSLGTPGIYRAIAKIAYGFACYKLPQSIILSEQFSSIRDYINGKTIEKKVSPNFLHSRFMTDGVRPLHKVLISYIKGQDIVVGYVTIFGTFQYTILLSDNFKSAIDWPVIDYTFNPITGLEIPVNLKFKPPVLTKDQILNPRNNQETVEIELQKGLNTIVNNSNGILKNVKITKTKA